MYVSSCCSAPFYDPGWPDNDICSECREHADGEIEEEEDMDDSVPSFDSKGNEVQDYGPPYSMANPTGEPISESLKIEDYDIATVEHLHDCLIEKEGYSLNHPLLKRSRELTAKLHKIVRSPVGAQPYPEWDCEKGCYILPKNKGIQDDPEC
jgi:hypothetical protein